MQKRRIKSEKLFVQHADLSTWHFTEETKVHDGIQSPPQGKPCTALASRRCFFPRAAQLGSVRIMVVVVVVVVAFSSRARILGECSIHYQPTLFFFFFFFFPVKRRLARAHQFHSLGHDQSTMAKQAETTVAERVATTLAYHFY